MYKLKEIYLVGFLPLLVVSVFMFYGIAQAGAVPDGFIGVPWGASGEQIIKTMNERGFQRLTSSTPGLTFRGDFAEASCQLSFSLAANSFYFGQANYCARSNHPFEPRAHYRYIFKTLSNKYGPPSETEDVKTKTHDSGEFANQYAWWFLVDSRNSDKYTIRLYSMVTWFGDNTGDQYVFGITYHADSLGNRLQERSRTKEW